MTSSGSLAAAEELVGGAPLHNLSCLRKFDVRRSLRKHLEEERVQERRQWMCRSKPVKPPGYLPSNAAVVDTF